MRNPSAYVSIFLNAQICCILIMILYASLVLGLGLARTMLIFEKINRIIFAKIFDFKFSHRRGGVANFTGVAASGGGVHPWVPGKFSNEKPTEIISEVIALNPKMYSVMTKNFYPIVKILIIAPHLVSSVILSLQRDHQNSLKKDPSRRL